MNLNLKVSQIKIRKIFKPSWILGLILCMVLALEIYTFYKDVYQNVTTDIVNVPNVQSNVAHLDFPSYQKILDSMDQSNTFSPQNNITNNPFK